MIPAAIIRCRPVGVLMMEDEHGGDEKIIAVPIDKLNPYYTKVENYTDLPTMLRDQIAHFFRHYKDLEAGKWVRDNALDGQFKHGARRSSNRLGAPRKPRHRRVSSASRRSFGGGCSALSYSPDWIAP